MDEARVVDNVCCTYEYVQVEREVKKLCDKFGYEFSKEKLDSVYNLYSNETNGVLEFCCLFQFTNIRFYDSDLLNTLNLANLNEEHPCVLGVDKILYLYTQITKGVGWSKQLVYCYNQAMQYTLPF